MIFERGVWRETARNFWANKWVVVLAVGLILGVSFLQDLTNAKSSGATWVEFAWLPVAVAAHATILKGQSGYATLSGNQYKVIFLPFLWRSLGLSVIGIIPALVIVIAFVGAAKEGLMILALMTVYGAIASFVLAKWGTMLPACVAEGDKSFKAAGARGSQTFTYVLGRFWMCNAVVLVVGLIGSFILYLILSAEFGTEPNASMLSPLGFSFNLVTTVVFAFNLVMLATILSRAYLIAERKIKEAPVATSTSY